MSDGEGSSAILDDEFRPQIVVHKTDSPVSSPRYSSCGESEFERYCSANSVMGTPSLCSSVGAFHECGDSDFGESTRSFGTVEGDFDLDGRLPISPLDKVFRGAMDYRDFTMVVDGSSGDLEEEIDGGRKSKQDLGVLLSNVEKELLDGNVTIRTIGDDVDGDYGDDTNTDESHLMRRDNELVLHSGFGGKVRRPSVEIEERDDGYGDRDGASSSYEQSEGEDSMFNSGSDGENNSNIHYTRQNHNNNYELEAQGGNMMLMSSSIAFGSHDWEDFELERRENGSTSEIFDDSWQKTQSSGAENGDVSLTSAPIALTNLVDQDEGTNDVHGVAESRNSAVENSVNSSVDCFESTGKEILGSARDAFVSDRKNSSDHEEIEYLEGCDVYNIFEKPNSLSPVGSMIGITENDIHFDPAEQVSGHDGNCAAKLQDQLCNQEQLGSSSDMMFGQVHGSTNNILEGLAVKNILVDEPAESSDKHKFDSLSSGSEGNMERIRHELDQTIAKLPPMKDKDLELNAFYDEVVHDMEEILMDSLDSPFNRLRQSSVNLHSPQPSPLRDRDSTASTSGAFGDYPLTSRHAKIDGIEVVGAKQKKGDISLSERLVGVKEHTVYVIRVWSGGEQWEVEHRYRDFYTLYRRLKSLFADQGWVLPSSWSAVEWESRKFFGNSSPDVVLERSALIQECLRSVIQLSYPSGLPNALIWFLSPPNALSNSSPYHQSAVESNAENHPTLGNTVSLIVDIRPHKYGKQILEEQHYVCPGCHKHLDGGKTRFQEFVQSFGLGKPRLCEYMGRLFCSSCHTNDTAVLPARVLHHWDFTQYPVSQLAKLYLDSIIDQPMLCVSAVNPFLMSKVKVLLHVVTTRTRIRALLEYVHCPFRVSIYRGLGSRKYLVDSTDFFSLRNLIDLSRGAFAVLPTFLETILKKIQQHITEQCLVCCDIGVSCGARQLCHDVSSLIFPFQDENEVERCHACKIPFHKNCFAKLTECQCGARLKPDVVSRSTSNLSLVPSGGGSGGVGGGLSFFRMNSELGLRSSTEFLSKLLSTERRERSMADHRNSSNVILMGSLPGNSL